AASLWAMEYRLRDTNREVADRVRALRKELEREFGRVTRLTSALLGPVLWLTSWMEDRRAARGKTYNPGMVVDRRHWTGSSAPANQYMARQMSTTTKVPAGV